jgi:hypothetical protein
MQLDREIEWRRSEERHHLQLGRYRVLDAVGRSCVNSLEIRLLLIVSFETDPVPRPHDGLK